MTHHCTKCGDEINEGIITFEKQPYHNRCLACHQCDKPLSGKTIYKHEGNNYDAECYTECHAKRCNECEKPLTDPGVKYTSYDGKTFHPECFTCDNCNVSLSGKSIYKHEDKNLDVECYTECHARKCAVCEEPLTDPGVKYTTFDEKTFHPDCFTCDRCDVSLSGKTIYKHEGKNIDAECYNEFYAVKCNMCDETLADPGLKYTTYDGMTFHPDCFTCDRCDVTLQDEAFFIEPEGNEKICETCENTKLNEGM